MGGRRLYLNKYNKDLNESYFTGMLIGGYTWGSLADVFGRKRTLMTAMLFNGVCGLVSSLSPNFIFFLIFRLASGIGYVEMTVV